MSGAASRTAGRDLTNFSGSANERDREGKKEAKSDSAIFAPPIILCACVCGVCVLYFFLSLLPMAFPGGPDGGKQDLGVGLGWKGGGARDLPPPPREKERGMGGRIRGLPISASPLRDPGGRKGREGAGGEEEEEEGAACLPPMRRGGAGALAAAAAAGLPRLS